MRKKLLDLMGHIAQDVEDTSYVGCRIHHLDTCAGLRFLRVGIDQVQGTAQVGAGKLLKHYHSYYSLAYGEVGTLRALDHRFVGAHTQTVDLVLRHVLHYLAWFQCRFLHCCQVLDLLNHPL